MKTDKQVLLTAIERLIQAHERYEKVRLLSPVQFQELCLRNIRENVPFDQLVDELPSKIGKSVVIDADVLSISLSSFNFSTRIKNVFKAEGFSKVGDLAGLGEVSILKLNHMGRGSLKELKDKLLNIGIELGDLYVYGKNIGKESVMPDEMGDCLGR